MSVIISNWIETSVAEALQLNVAKSAVYFAYMSSSSFHKCSRVAGYNQSVLMPNQAATSGWQIKVPKSFIVHVSFCITTLRGVKFATWTLELTDRCPDAGIYRLNWISPSCLCLLKHFIDTTCWEQEFPQNLFTGVEHQKQNCCFQI